MSQSHKVKSWEEASSRSIKCGSEGRCLGYNKVFKFETVIRAAATERKVHRSLLKADKWSLLW